MIRFFDLNYQIDRNSDTHRTRVNSLTSRLTDGLITNWLD